MNVKIRKLDVKDVEQFKNLILVFEDVFEMKDFTMPDSSHLASLLSNSDFIVFTASIDGQVVGGLTAYVLHQYYSTRPLAYIYDLAVKQDYQRKGIGKNLIDSFNQDCQANGFEEVFVQADQSEQYAIDFYRSTRPTEEEPVVHFYYTL